MRSKLSPSIYLHIIRGAPDILPKIMRFMYRKKFDADRDIRRGDGIASRPPYMVSLRITNACNHRCPVCGQYGAKGYMSVPEKRRELLKTLPVGIYKEIVDDLAYYRPFYYATGGEPFLYPGIVELLNYAKTKGSNVFFVTNGVKLEQYAEEIVRNGWDLLVVSFDGPEHIHDECRRTPGAYKTAIQGLRAVQQWRARLKKARPFIVTSTTLSRVNAECLDETYEIGRVIHPDLMAIFLSWFTSEQLGQAQQQLLQDSLGVEAYTWKAYAREFTEETARLFMENLDRVEKRKWPFQHLVIPAVSGTDVRDYYLQPSNMLGFSKCITPFLEVNVMPNGDVVTCRDYIDVKVGNITEKKLLDIWNGDGFVRFRKLLMSRGGLLPQCTRCCGLMGF
ncbi:MAG: radical SAM protein [Spirochaetia bacterium]|jgi:radical SAM protein with 4Fe4S-binding SPASM domain